MCGLELSFIWAGIIAFAVLVYVIMDSFDLGIGILFPVTKDESERNVMMNSVAPAWDGNETWLVLDGGGLVYGVPAGLCGGDARALYPDQHDASGADFSRCGV